eukprot:7147978-Alexandrium_andersonii.AAC.1
MAANPGRPFATLSASPMQASELCWHRRRSECAKWGCALVGESRGGAMGSLAPSPEAVAAAMK